MLLRLAIDSGMLGPKRRRGLTLASSRRGRPSRRWSCTGWWWATWTRSHALHSLTPSRREAHTVSGPVTCCWLASALLWIVKTFPYILAIHLSHIFQNSRHGMSPRGIVDEIQSSAPIREASTNSFLEFAIMLGMSEATRSELISRTVLPPAFASQSQAYG